MKNYEVRNGQVKIDGSLYESYALKDLSEVLVHEHFIAHVGTKCYILHKVNRLKTDIKVCYSFHGQIVYDGKRFLCGNEHSVICHKEGSDVFIDFVHSSPLQVVVKEVTVKSNVLTIDGLVYGAKADDGEYKAFVYANIADLYSGTKYHGQAFLV